MCNNGCDGRGKCAGEGTMREFDIHAEIAKLPSCPGVYIMHDSHDRILYVGKAKILKRRVSQYFRE